jgi:hypothetical protein
MKINDTPEELVRELRDKKMEQETGFEPAAITLAT